MLTYNLDDRGGIPLYEYLYNCIKKDILQGKIKADEKLPSKRELAKNLSISIITVQNAYEQLVAEGYIYAVEKRGYFASGINLLKPFEEDRIENSKDDSDEIYGKNLSDSSDEAAGSNNYFIDFRTSSINYEKFPFSIWSKIMRQVLTEQEEAFTRNLPSMGLDDLRKAIEDYLYQFRGMNVSYRQIIIGAGTEYLYSLIIQLLGLKNVIAIEDPGHRKVSQIYTVQGAVCKHIPLDNYGMDIEKLKSSGANIAHISPSHHFPTGIVMPVKRRHQLLKWADEDDDRYIIEDDYDSEFRFTGRPIPTMQSTDYNEKVIYVNTFSKTLMPSIRIAYMVLPPHLVKKYNEKMGFYSCTVSGFEQMALAKFISEGYYERHINRMRNYYRTHRNNVIQAIKESELGKCSQIKEENSGLHFILKIKTEMEDDLLVKKAGEKGVNISCVSEYCTDTAEQFKHMFLINYSNADEERVKDAMKIIYDIAKKD